MWIFVEPLIFKDNFRFLSKKSIGFFFENFNALYSAGKPPSNWYGKFRSLPKISIFKKNFDVSEKFRCFRKISMFTRNFHVSEKFRWLIKISISKKKFDVSEKFRCFRKISMFTENFDVSEKFQFQKKFRGLPKISIKKMYRKFTEGFYSRNFRLQKNSIFTENFDL